MTATATARVAAYNAEPWIGECVEAILGQTRAPDEVVIVDDGSTDGTARELARFGDAIRVVKRRNGGCPAAFNTAIAHATSDYVALCGADDIWEPHKLEWQMGAITADPELDILFGDAALFGLSDGRYARPPGSGRLDSRALLRALYRVNIVCAPSVMIRRSIFERLGPFVEQFGADDYEYWMRSLRAGAVFYYDPRILLRYRRHEGNLSSRLRWMRECSHEVHLRYHDLVEDREEVRAVVAEDLFEIGRHLVDEQRWAEARTAFRRSARLRPAPRTAAWLSIATLPPRIRTATGRGAVRLRARTP